jgi:serine/threonine-protein kinase
MDRARREGRFLPQADVLRWAAQLANALEYMHSQDPPVIHRDIKPSNLKITPSGLLKLVDFGLVKQMAPGETTVTVIQGRGTAQYTPLEQYGGDAGHTDPRSDVYAFGATLYHILTNTPPPEAKLRFLNASSLRAPRELNPDISPHVEQAILWAIALHPADRPRDVAAFRVAFQSPDLGAEVAHRLATVLAPDRVLPTRDDQLLASLAAGLLVLAVLATLL